MTHPDSQLDTCRTAHGGYLSFCMGYFSFYSLVSGEICHGILEIRLKPHFMTLNQYFKQTYNLICC